MLRLNIVTIFKDWDTTYCAS